MEAAAINSDQLLSSVSTAASSCLSKCNADASNDANGVRHRSTADDNKGGNASKRQLPSYSEYMQSHPDAQLLGINGKWYCVKNFVARHPGGDVMLKFVGKDATPVYKAFHDKDVLKHFRPVAEFETDYSDPAAKIFEDLHRHFVDQGFFKTNLVWYLGKVLVAIAFLIATVLLIVKCDSTFCHCLAGLALAGFWQQCGFFLHDFMHNECFHNRKLDSAVGTFFGTVCVGVNSRWWQEEHFVHHALTNTVDYSLGFFDPQMREELWAQHSKLFPFFRSRLEYYAIKCQFITFMPLCTVLGRAAIVYYGYLKERRIAMWLAQFAHWAWVIALFSQLPTWRQIFITYFIANVLEGVLHIQLLISHYCKGWYERQEICETKNWYRMQVEANVNIMNPVWMDWFHGGLNLHIEHHLFPLMPRNRFREARILVKDACKRANIHYDECGWFAAIGRTMSQLRKAGRHFSLDPR